MVHEVYDSLFFSSNFLFPLEGKCHVVAKGCTGQSSDVIFYRYPDRQSAASLATSWSSPPCKQVALVLISAVVKFFHKRAPSINVRRPPQPSAAEPLSNLRTFGATAPSNFRTLKPHRAPGRLYGFRCQRRYKNWRRRRRTSPAQRYYITPEGESPQPACKAKPITGRTLGAQGQRPGGAINPHARKGVSTFGNTAKRR